MALSDSVIVWVETPQGMRAPKLANYGTKIWDFFEDVAVEAIWVLQPTSSEPYRVPWRWAVGHKQACFRPAGKKKGGRKS